MARGFESKSVANQQDAAIQDSPEPLGRDPVDPAHLAHRRRLELSRVDVARRLATASASAHREILRRALEAIDAEIAGLD